MNTISNNTRRCFVSSVLLLLLLLFSQSSLSVFAFHRKIIQKITGKQQYTPLLFFKVPKGLMAECDAMEKVVREIEKELNVRVERMDVLRNPANEALLELITFKTPPFLYHRESCQSYHTKPSFVSSSSSSQQQQQGGSGSTKKNQKQLPIRIDKEKVRAWAKGRYLKTSYYHQQKASSSTSDKNTIKVKAPPPIIAQQSATADDDDDNNENNNSSQQLVIDPEQQAILEDMALTPEQRKGKQLIQERTDALKVKQRTTNKQTTNTINK